MKIHEISFDYAHSSYQITFVSKPLFRSYLGIGKSYPKTTQCTIKRDGLIIGLGTVTKHWKDKDNPKYARAYAAKQAINNGNLRHWKELRREMWKEIMKLKDL